MDSWDPMAADFKDKNFNRYSEGVGRDLLDSNGSAVGAKLYVGNLPKNLGHEGLFNLFAEYGAVEEARIMQSDKDYTYGFVTMRSAVEAERAISKLHQKKLGNACLRVNVALTKEEREHRKQIKERESQIMNSLKKDFNWDEVGSVKSGFSDSRREGSVRNEHFAFGGRNQAFFGNESMGRGALAFSQPPLNIGRGFGRQMMPFENFGPGPLFQGRGSAVGWHEGGAYMNLPGFAGQGIHPLGQPQMQRPFDMGKQGSAGHFIDIQVPENPRLQGMKCCTYCRKEGCEYLCSRCRMYYCSVECQKLDWPNHKDICMAFGVYYKSRGEPDLTKLKQNGVKTKKSPRKPKGGGKHESDNSTSQDDSDTRTSTVGPTQKGNSNTQNSTTQGQGALKAKKTSKPKNSKEININKPSKLEVTSNLNQGGAEVEKGASMQAEKGGLNQSINGVDDKEDATAANGGAGDASYGQIQMTIPIGSSGMAYLTHYESPDKFWISLVEHLEDFTETTVLMAKQESCSPPTKPKPRDTFGALWEGEWARVEILSVTADEVTCYFIDYGNTGVVKIKDLRPLTVDIIKLPAQALCCCVSKMKPKGSSWSESAISKVNEWFGPPMSKYFSFEVVAIRGSKNAVKISIDNEALSELLLSNDFGERDTGEPGLPSITAGPKQGKVARFTVNDLKWASDMVNVGDQLTAAMLSLESVRKFVAMQESAADILPELEALMDAECFAEQPPYRPSAGDVVAAVYSEDKKWYRSQVLSVKGHKCSLFFVDYGNIEDQEIQYVKEITSQKIKAIPAQALVCCLHGLDPSTPASVSEKDIILEFAQQLPNFQVDETWTLLSVKGKGDECLFVDVVSTRGLSLVEALRKKFPELENRKAQASLSTNKLKNVDMNIDRTKASLSHPQTAADIAKPVTMKTVTKPLEVKGERLAINPDKKVSAKITYVHDCSHFYVCPSNNVQKFEAMMKKLNQSVQRRPKFEGTPAIGSVAVVQFSADKCWYRGRIQSVEAGGRCKVMFIDYGNSEMVPWEEMRELDANMCKLPAQAVRCRLAGELEQLSAASHGDFKDYLENNTVDLKVIGGDVDGVLVQIYAHGTDVNAALFGIDMSTSQERKTRKIKNLILESGCTTKVECVNMVSPTGFYVQVTSQVAATMAVTLDIKNRLEKSPEPMSSIAVGDFVASRFSEDSDVIWYRGRVDQVTGDKALIYFLDFGNFEERDKADLMCLSEQDCSESAATLKCQLQGCETSTPELDSDFARDAQSQIDSIRVIKQNEKNCVVDILDRNGLCISSRFQQPQRRSSVKHQGQPGPPGTKPKVSPSPDSLVSPVAALRLSTESLGELSSFTDVGVSHIDSFSSIYVVSTDSDRQTKLAELMMSLNQMAESLPQLFQPREGSLCAACFSEDGIWYRARVVSMASVTCVVQFVDYGNSEKTLPSQLREVKGDDSFMQLPAQAVKCCLVGFESDLDGNSRAGADLEAEAKEIGRLRAKLFEKTVRIKLVRTIGDTLVVDMESEQQSISKMFKRRQPGPQGAKPKVSPSPDSLVSPVAPLRLWTESLGELSSFTDVGVSHIDSFSSIYVVSTDSDRQTKLAELMMSLNQMAGSLPQLSQPREGSLCAACFSEDGIWYRARVVSVASATCVVQFVDYGNSEKTLPSQLREIKGDNSFMQLPAQAVKCCLVGFESDLDGNCRAGADLEAEAKEIGRLRAKLFEKTVRIKLVRTIGDTLVVDMESEQQSISKMFKKPSVTNIPMLIDLVHEKPSETEFDAFVVQLTNLDEFYCHRYNEKEGSELMMMGELLQSDVSHLPHGLTCTPVVGGLYISEFQGTWYRCVVQKIMGSQVCIKYIDFGNCEEKSAGDLRPLERKRLAMPVRILKCKLYGVTPVFPGWEHPDMPTYLALLSEKQLRLKVHEEDDDGTLLVSLLIDDGQGILDVGQDLVRIGMATDPSQAVAAAPQIEGTGDDSEDELELAKQIEQLQKMLQEAKLKKAKGARK
ncbi:hypothetical protein RRG08_035875 [Elysia crispata]|uniref:Tudor domain-containing protein 1 n=1 Tax=Elysia crispata TaxID=231223 RepID=A0AAE1A325_9GAST|nr:hypothetical protein RRG08_035875 [Elysia crispata]